MTGMAKIRGQHGRLKRDYSRSAEDHYRRVRAEWEATQAQQAEDRRRLIGGVTEFPLGNDPEEP